MNIPLTFIVVIAAMTAFSFAEAYVEGRNAGDKGKLGFKVKIMGVTFAAYHFWLFYVMFPLLIVVLPLVVLGRWDSRVFGVLVSAFCLGVIVEDCVWYIVNPVVKFMEIFTDFSDYYPWIKFRGRKIVPVVYVTYGIVCILSWYFLWR